LRSYVLSARSEADIESIAQTSLEQWGVVRAEQYVLALHALFQRLAEFPELGREMDHIRAGLLRMRSGSHLVFYRKTSIGVRIVRILHQRMDFERRL